MNNNHSAGFERLLSGEINKPKFNLWKIVGAYAVFGFLWILFSDQILAHLVKEAELLLRIQTFKGWMYVALTASLLYFLIEKEHKQFSCLLQQLVGKNQDLTSYSEELMAIEEELQGKIICLEEAFDDLQEHKLYIDEIFEKSNTAIVLWQFSGEIIDANQHFLKIIEYRKEEIIGKKWIELLIEAQDKATNKTMIKKLRTNGSVKNFQNKLYRPNKSVVEMIWNSSLIINPKTKAQVIVSFGTDITLEKENERTIYRLAYTDQLTGLKNRVMFEKELEKHIVSKTTFNLYYIDFDDFKLLNDLHGHRIGDVFLKLYAKVLREEFPATEIFRWSGDEFIMLEKTTVNSNLDNTVTKLFELTNRKWTVEYLEYYPAISIGVTAYPEDGTEVYELLKTIDMALHRAKKEGKNRHFKYQKYLQIELERMIRIEEELEIALEQDGFSLNFQPIYTLLNEEIDNIEVLLRWQPAEIKITTSEFISIAEKTGQIVYIDKWVLRNVFKFVYENAQDLQCGVSINLSVQSINSGLIIDFLNLALAEYPINPKQVSLEITEHSLINNFEHSRDILTKLKDLGFKIALDDFGTRYSSLNYLSKMPFDCLKIDKSYVDNIVLQSKDNLIISQIIKLSTSLGMKTVAEGIESKEQKELLKELGCNYGQGFYFARPMGAEEIIKILKSKAD